MVIEVTARAHHQGTSSFWRLAWECPALPPADRLSEMVRRKIRAQDLPAPLTGVEILRVEGPVAEIVTCEGIRSNGAPVDDWAPREVTYNLMAWPRWG